MEQIESEFQKVIDFLKSQLGTLQTGRANPALIEDLPVNCFGATQPLKHLANISVQDAQSMLVSPWDKNVLVEIEKAFARSADLGLAIKNEGTAIRVNILPLTQERRHEIVKKAHDMAEHSRVAIRNVRHEEHANLKKQKDAKEISEDEFFRMEKKLQEKVDTANGQVDTVFRKKERDLLEI